MADEVQVRRAQSPDAAVVRALTRQAYARWIPLIGREPKPMTADYEAAVQNHLIDLLYLDGALAGLVEMIDEGDQLLVENLAVAPDLQGRGLGSRLLTHAENFARSLGYRRVRLYTNQKFTENIRLYTRLGYVIEREVVADEGTVRIDMAKILEDPAGKP